MTCSSWWWQGVWCVCHRMFIKDSMFEPHPDDKLDEVEDHSYVPQTESTTYVQKTYSFLNKYSVLDELSQKWLKVKWWKGLYPDHAKLLGNVKDFLIYLQKTKNLQRTLNKGLEKLLRNYSGLTQGKSICRVAIGRRWP